MAITVKDIHEKEFSRQVRGYNIDEVDDFLDEIANQLEMLIRENRALAQKLEGAEIAVPAEKKEVCAPFAAPVQESAPVVKPVVIVTPTPVVETKPVETSTSVPAPIGDEPTYFKNLETTLRETLISAQRIADETVAEARKKANQLLASADEQAKAIVANSQAEAESARAENVELRKASEDYRARFLRLVEDQMHVLKADSSMFE